MAVGDGDTDAQQRERNEGAMQQEQRPPDRPEHQAQDPEEWTVKDLDEYGTYAIPHFAHSQMYYVRDVSKRWCEEACARNDMQTARKCAERYERAQQRLLAWRCRGCAICPPPPPATT